jgi:hypothetical protein
MKAALVLLVGLAAAGAAAHACEPALSGADAQRIAGQHYVLAWRSAAPIRLSEFFGLEIAVCAKDGGARPAALRVDARMPAHQHGMNYQPKVVALGDGRFAASGLLLHMLGRWEFVFDVGSGAASPAPRESLRSTVEL